jgi:hypothetical protein
MCPFNHDNAPSLKQFKLFGCISDGDDILWRNADAESEAKPVATNDKLSKVNLIVDQQCCL